MLLDKVATEYSAPSKIIYLQREFPQYPHSRKTHHSPARIYPWALWVTADEKAWILLPA
jgi:hypothetical protein